MSDGGESVPANLSEEGKRARSLVKWDRRGEIPAFLGRAKARTVFTQWVPRALLLCLMLLFFVYFTRLALRLHYGYATSGFDLGIMDQGTWLLSRFKVPYSTVNGHHMFGDHSSFILIALAPLYWVFPSAATLLVVNCLALFSAALPAFLIARRLLRSEWLALIVAAAYLLHPTITSNSLWQFHPDALLAPLLLWAVWFMLQQRWRGFIVCIGLLLLVKEDSGAVALALGLYVAWRYDRRVGMAVAAASFLWLIVVWGFVLPYFRQGLPDAHSGRVPFGGVRETIVTGLKQPGEMLRHVTGEGRAWYLFQLLLPFAFLPLVSPFALVAAGPVGFNLLSTHGYQHQVGYHYSITVVAIFVVAAAMTLAAIRSAGRRRAVAGILFLLSLWMAYLWGPSAWSREPEAIPEVHTARNAVLRKAEGMIPPDAAVAANSFLVPHLSHRRYIYNLPTPFRVEYWGDPRADGKRLPEADLIEYVLTFSDVSPKDRILLDSLRQEGFKTLLDREGVLLMYRERAG